MQTKVSTKGQIVLPMPLRRKMGIRNGDSLTIHAKAGQIILSPIQRPTQKVRIVSDPATGLPVLDAGSQAPGLTSEEVEEILTGFP